MRRWVLAWLGWISFLSTSSTSTWGQVINRAPHFVHGGDMARLSISESTPPGVPVYTLLGEDPEASKLHYSISGEYLSVDRDTGVVVLRKALDRESQDLIEVIISITDEGIAESEPNTVSLRREIAVLDENDNAPTFLGRPYAARIPESAKVDSLLLPPGSIIVQDKDGGVNADVHVACIPASRDDDVCQVFSISTEQLAEGKYEVLIRVGKVLDYEKRNSYLINLVATDGAVQGRLQARVTVAVDVEDVQDQPPIFLNAPFSAALSENTEPEHLVLTIRARDGDAGDPRPVRLSLHDDLGGDLEEPAHFRLELAREGDVTLGRLFTTHSPLDRENPDILHNGGIYTFKVKATELINNEIPADTAVSTVTIIVTDVDDLKPTFNRDYFHIKVSEDTGTDTPLPGLNMVVSDEDVGENAKYKLALRDVPGYPGYSSEFTVSPRESQGRVPVVIKANNNDVLDYDSKDSDEREIEFEVIAIVSNTVVAVSRVHVEILDSNDNVAEFSKSIYKLSVPEDAQIGRRIGNVYAVDRDSGAFGRLAYSLRGFGIDKFKTDQKTGGIYVSSSLDYETQKSYSLTIEALDGGGKISTANVLIELENVNDNAPVFEQKQYSRIVREGATSFEPQLYVRATDADGATQGHGQITYTIDEHNSVTPDVFKVNSQSGEVTIAKAVRSVDTQLGVYELVVKATDGGSPPLSSETKVLVRVGVPGNQKPIFRGNYKPGTPGPSTYRARLLENALPGTEVIKVAANDPDGRDSLLQYKIASGAKDNFVIDSSSGIVTVSPDARLDLESGGSKYDIIVYAIDSGTPVRETATTTVTVNIVDVNNKPPVFNEPSYVVHVSEKATIGETVLKVTASDPDSDASLEYSIIEPIKAADKTGVALKSSAAYDLKRAFRINMTNGVIAVNKALDYQTTAVFILTVQARDVNALIDRSGQVAKAEVTIYVQAYSDDNPAFLNPGWSSNNPTIRLTLPEELPLGTTLLAIVAKESAINGGHPVQRFQLIRSPDDEDPNDSFVNVGVQSGNVVLAKRLDYETLTDKSIRFKVRALSRDYDITRKMSEANVIIEVKDVNDNVPTFNEKEYRVAVLESERPRKMILSVHAVDLDSARTPEEITRGYGIVRYSLTGENANMFQVDPDNGDIRIATNLDREWQSTLRFYVVASDMPQGGAEQKTARALVQVDVLDVNDNAPSFSQESYTTVIPENAAPGVSIINITATDPDGGEGGRVFYEIVDQGEAAGLFEINENTGQVRSVGELTGKGRMEAYKMRVRAQDGGSPELYSDAQLIVYVGDVVNNDGVPIFLRPSIDEVASIAENSSLGSPVFQVIASDPDDAVVVYGFLEDGNFARDASAFRIDRESGLITTREPLDRETKDSYNLVIVAQDLGEPPQQATRVLQVSVLDIDDHKPHFKRDLYNRPLELSVEEEVPVGSVVGLLEAVDEDIGDNGMIDYTITQGNEDGLFRVERLANNSAFLRSAARLDREEKESHLLTLRCFKYSEFSSRAKDTSYNPQDPSQRQVLVRLLDKDDNPPRFYPKDEITVGVRLNVPADTRVLRLEARDADGEAGQMEFSMGQLSFVSLAEPGAPRAALPESSTQPLVLDPKNGELRTGAASLAGFADGYLLVPVQVSNSRERAPTNATVRVLLLRDRDMLRFVFSRPPTQVREKLERFEAALERALGIAAVAVHVHDAQFYAKQDGSLDFSSTSSCFQVLGQELYDLEELRSLLTDSRNTELRDLYEAFHVARVEDCAASLGRGGLAEASLAQIWVLVIAALIALAACAASCALCCMHSAYKRNAKLLDPRQQHQLALRPATATLSYISGSAHGSHATLAPPNALLGESYEWAPPGPQQNLYRPA